MTAKRGTADSRIAMALKAGGDTLDLSDLGLKLVPPLPQQLLHIKHLNLSRNRLREFPKELFKLGDLEHLDLAANWLGAIPEDLHQFPRLTALDVSENMLRSLPKGLSQCRSLITLDCFSNELASLPTDWEPFEVLASLDLSSNQLTSLPDIAHLFPSLQHLLISQNRLSSWEIDLGEVPSLRTLDISDNYISKVADITRVSGLVDFYIEHNSLDGLRLERECFPNLRRFVSDFDQIESLKPTGDSELNQLVRTAVLANTIGGTEPGKEYHAAPNVLFEFVVVVSGLAAALTSIRLCFKARTTVVIKFPDNSVVELANVSRKTAIDLVQEHRRSIENKGISIAFSEAYGVDGTVGIIQELVSRLPTAKLIPAKADATSVTFINPRFVQYVFGEVNVGDHVNIIGNPGIVNFKSRLTNTKQIVGSMAGREQDKDKLIEAMEHLETALKSKGPEAAPETEAILDAAGDLTQKAAKPTPNKVSLAASAKTLLEIAASIGGILPLAEKVVDAIRTLTGF